ncbi:MAG: family 1 glycosylhydrolase [Planctomycetes bacterium]|nr:family 1 glycosylhydrolase [Planctomycetota bacterium]
MWNTCGIRWGVVCLLGLVAGGLTSCVPPIVIDVLTGTRPTVDAIDFTAFGESFLWGAGSSSHQHEGNDIHSDWWAWELDGHTKTGETSGLAADFWNRYEEDLDRAQSLNLNTFRISLSWARLFPEPDMSAPDEEAVAGYDAMFAAMAARNIRPMVTLHHFAMPKWLTDQNRWETGAAIADFEQFARFAAQRWGKYVDWWITINEPQVFALHGWWRGVFPPGKTDLGLGLSVFLNLMYAHGHAYHAIKEVDTVDADGDGLAAEVGVAMLLVPIVPFYPWDLIDVVFAAVSNELTNTVWFDIEQIGIPEVVVPFGPGLVEPYPDFKDTLDFIGVNYYSRQVVHIVPPFDLLFDPLPIGTRGTLGHEVYPEGLYDVMEQVARYGVPLIVTESGVADDTDELRADHIIGHLAELTRFVDDHPDVPVLGYVHWALTDHFEWENGFGPRFGLYEVDFATLERTPRPSSAVYADIVARARGLE